MPPKKLSKKELDRKKKEEEERKLQEEEEARRLAEQEERDLLQREKTEAEERKKIEKQELKKRAVELDEYRVFLDNIEQKLSDKEVNSREQYKWDRYMKCDGSPDPAILQEINTYMNLWMEDDENVTIDPIMNESILCLRLIEELEYLIDMHKQYPEFKSEVDQFFETSQKLQLLLQDKLDRASLEMLNRANMIKDPDSANLNTSWKFDKMVLCLWGNLSKQQKQFEVKFDAIRMTLILPRVKMLADAALRILYTNFDHYSQLSSYYCPRKKEIVEPEPEPVEEENPKEQDGEDAPKEEETKDEPEEAKEDVGMNLLAELNKASGEAEEEKEETIQEQEEELDLPPEDLVPCPELTEWEDFDGEENVIDLRNFSPIGGLYHINIVNLPPQSKTVNNWTMTHKVVPPHMTHLPYEVVQTSISNIGEMQINDSAKLTRAMSEYSEKTDVTQMIKPVAVTLKLPSNLVVAEEPQLALWDPNTKQWNTGSINVIEYKESESTVQFELLKFGILGLFQDVHVNMPYLSWNVRPYRFVPDPMSSPNKGSTPISSNKSRTPMVEGGKETGVSKSADIGSEFGHSNTAASVAGQGHPEDDAILHSGAVHFDYDPDCKYQCLITIAAAIFEVKLHVCNNRVRILKDDQQKELHPLAGRWYTVRGLINMMRHCGINIFPREDSHKYINVTKKNRIAETRLYDQIALMSPSMAFAWSRWNSKCDSDEKIILLGCEHLNYERLVNEDEWKVLSFTRKKVEKLNMLEYDENFVAERDDNVEFHSNLYHLYQEIGSEEGMVPIKSMDIQYYDTVRTLLGAIRPAVYA